MQKGIPKQNTKEILLIEGHPFVRMPLERLLTSRGHRVTAVETGEEGLKAAASEQFDTVVCNHHLPGISGLVFYSKSRARFSKAITILTASFAGDYLANDAIAMGINVFMEMPFKIENLLACIEGRFQDICEGSLGGHLYVTSGGQMMVISPSPSDQGALIERPIKAMYKKAINVSGRQWKLYLNPDAPYATTENEITPCQTRKRNKRAGITIVDPC